MEYTELFKKCFKKEKCIRVGLKKYCKSVEGCVRIIHSDSKFKIELSVFGHSITYDLAETCYPVYEKGIGRINVCTKSVDIVNGNLKKVTLKVELCVGTKVAGIPLEKCWDVYEADIEFFMVSAISANELAAFINEEELLYGYIENNLATHNNEITTCNA